MNLDAAKVMEAIGSGLPSPSTFKFGVGELTMACKLTIMSKIYGDREKLANMIEDRAGRLAMSESKVVRSALEHLRSLRRVEVATVGIGGSLGWSNREEEPARAGLPSDSEPRT